MVVSIDDTDKNITVHSIGGSSGGSHNLMYYRGPTEEILRTGKVTDTKRLSRSQFDALKK